MLRDYVRDDSPCWSAHQMRDEELLHFGCTIEERFRPGLQEILEKEQQLGERLREWRENPADDGCRARYVLALCALVECWPRLERLGDELADLMERLEG